MYALDVAPDRAADRDPPGGAGAALEIIHDDFGHRQPVTAPLVSAGARRHVVGAVLVGRERQPAVAPLAAVVVPRGVHQPAVGIVDPDQIRIRQGAVARRRSLEIDPVGPARLEGNLEPVAVVPVLKLPVGRTANHDRTARAGVGCEIVQNLGHRQTVAARAASPAPDLHIVSNVRFRLVAVPRPDRHLAGAEVPVRLVEPEILRNRQRAAAVIVPLQVDPVEPARLEGHLEPVAVARGLDLPRNRTANRDGAGRLAIR